MRMPAHGEIALEALLAARDSRAEKQRALLAQFSGRPLACLLVNMPGPVKRTAESDRVFAAGVSAFTEALRAGGISLLFAETRAPETGCEAYLVPDADAEAVKRVACALEAALPYGRLLDIDVHAPDGAQLSRVALGYPPRGCMVCGAAGAGCASRRLHAVPELVAAFNRIAATAPEERP